VGAAPMLTGPRAESECLARESVVVESESAGFL